MDKIKGSGVIPMVVSDKEGWQGGHLLSISLSSAVGSETMDQLINGEKSWDSPEVVDSLAVWHDFQKAGYLNPSPTAVTYDNGNALFYSGKAAMNPTGSWLALDIERNVKFDVGFIPFPAPDGPGIFSGGLGSGTFVNATTKHADAAIKFLDYGMTEEHGGGRWRSCRTSRPTRSTPPASRPVRCSSRSWTTRPRSPTAPATSATTSTCLTPDAFNNAMWKGMQGLLTDQTTPEKVAAQLQTAYEKSKK